MNLLPRSAIKTQQCPTLLIQFLATQSVFSHCKWWRRNHTPIWKSTAPIREVVAPALISPVRSDLRQASDVGDGLLLIRNHWRYYPTFRGCITGMYTDRPAGICVCTKAGKHTNKDAYRCVTLITNVISVRSILCLFPSFADVQSAAATPRVFLLKCFFPRLSSGSRYPFH